LPSSLQRVFSCACRCWRLFWRRALSLAGGAGLCSSPPAVRAAEIWRGPEALRGDSSGRARVSPRRRGPLRQRADEASPAGPRRARELAREIVMARARGEEDDAAVLAGAGFREAEQVAIEASRRFEVADEEGNVTEGADLHRA